MKTKMSTIALALGLTATPAFAKNSITKRGNTKEKPGIYQKLSDMKAGTSSKIRTSK